MSELLSSIVTPEMRVAMIIVVILLIALYVLSIVWVIRDAYLRDANHKLWGAIAIIPVAGVIAYCLMRPPLMQLDRDEQELEIAFKQRELQKYGRCGSCGYPIESDYILCPNCHTQLKNMCMQCGKPLNAEWDICPYCATPTQPLVQQGRAQAGRGRTRAR